MCHGKTTGGLGKPGTTFCGMAKQMVILKEYELSVVLFEIMKERSQDKNCRIRFGTESRWAS